MSNEKWTLTQKVAMVFAVLLAASFIANVILAGYISTIQSLAESKPSYTYVVGVVYEEVRFYSKPDIHGGYVSWLRKVPVYDVSVTLEDEVIYTDSCGYFEFAVEVGTHELKFEKLGYYTEYRIVHTTLLSLNGVDTSDLEHIEVEMKQKIVLMGGEVSETK